MTNAYIKITINLIKIKKKTVNIKMKAHSQY